MKRNSIIALVIGGALLVALLMFSMTYSVRFNEVALITTFGNAGDANSVKVEPGLHLKLPAPIQAARTFDRRLQLVDTRLETHTTRDGLQVEVQAFTFWRIDDSPQGVLDFNESFGSIEAARDQLESRMRSAVGALSEFEFEELVGEGNRLVEAEERIKQRLMASGAMTEGGAGTLADLGIRIEKVGLSQIMLPVQTTTSVVTRMKDEREQRAGEFMDRGASEATNIASATAATVETIEHYAGRLAAELRARGDELATRSIAIMNEDPEFAVFLIWLDGLERTTQGVSTFFLPTSMAPFHLLDFEGGDFAGAPMPRDATPELIPAGDRAGLARDGMTPGGGDSLDDDGDGN